MAITVAYTVLRDEKQRAAYDQQLGQQAQPAQPSSSQGAAPTGDSAEGPRRAPDEFLRRSTLQRLRRAVEEEWQGAKELVAPGFDLAIVMPGRRGLFQRATAPITLLARMVDTVDAGSVEAVWPDAARVPLDPGGTAFVVLVGASLQPRQEIAEAIARARRRWPAWSGVVLAPVNARDWKALVPADAPASARRLLDHLARA